MTGDHLDRDGIPLPSGPLEDASGGEVAARVAAAGEPRWLIQGLWPADAYGVLAAPGAGSELTAIQAELAAHPAALVVLDPLYLAAAGASGANLYDMGAVLQAIQGVCQQAGCALLVVTHWNKTGDGRGPDRISWAGPAAWARVICSVAVHYRGSDPDGASTVLLGVELIGGEIADTRFRIRRRIRADDPADLGTPLWYSVGVLAAEDEEDLDPAAAACPSPANGSWLLCGAAGTSRRSGSWGTGWPRPGIRSGPTPSRPPSASSRKPAWRRGARKATAGPATGHQPPPPPIAAATKPATTGKPRRHDSRSSISPTRIEWNAQ